MPLHAPHPDASRTLWLRHARALALVTVAYNLVEGLVAMGFGLSDDALALFGFGADSFIEVGSALLVLWRLQGDEDGCAATRLRKERRTAMGIAVLFLLLASGTALGALLQLTARRHPDTTWPGLVVSALSLAFMIWLWRAKLRAASALDSRTLQGDAACSRICIQLSLVLFAGSLLFLLHPALWWADGAAALVLSGFIGREGLQGLRAAMQKDFSGGCGCH